MLLVLEVDNTEPRFFLCLSWQAALLEILYVSWATLEASEKHSNEQMPLGIPGLVFLLTSTQTAWYQESQEGHA